VAFTRAKEQLVHGIPPDERFDAAWMGRQSRGPGISRTPVSRFVFVVNLLTTVSLWGSVSGRPSGSDPEAKLPDAPAEVNGLLNRYPERSAYPKAMPR
jgi:DNA helicase II / ATP-dependent DNA helicase PcrA